MDSPKTCGRTHLEHHGQGQTKPSSYHTYHIIQNLMEIFKATVLRHWCWLLGARDEQNDNVTAPLILWWKLISNFRIYHMCMNVILRLKSTNEICLFEAKYIYIMPGLITLKWRNVAKHSAVIISIIRKLHRLKIIIKCYIYFKRLTKNLIKHPAYTYFRI